MINKEKIRLAQERNLEFAYEQMLKKTGTNRDEFESKLAIGKQARAEVCAAVALCKYAWVEDGILQVDGSRQKEFRERLSRFNRVPDGFSRSLAAYYYESMFKEINEETKGLIA